MLFDDFFSYTDAQLWTKGGTGASVTAGNAQAGVLAVATDGTVNHEAWVATTNELVLEGVAPTGGAPGILGSYVGRPFYAECRYNYQEIGTNNAQVLFGLADAWGTGLIGNTGTLAVTTTGALVYKKTGETVWHGYGQNGSTNSDTKSIQTAACTSATEFHTLGVYGQVVDTLNYRLSFFMDGQPLLDTSARPNKVSCLIPFASAVAMNFGVYVKAASANALTLNIDYLALAFARF